MPKTPIVAALLAATLLSGCQSGALSSSRSEVHRWSFQLDSHDYGIACADAVRFEWGSFAMVNLAGDHGRRCGGSGNIGNDDPLPSQPFSASWKDWAGKPHAVTLPLKEILAPYTVYGGDLRLLIHNDRLEVWLREPDKSKSPSGTLWLTKDEVLVYSTDPALPSSFWTFQLNVLGLDQARSEKLSDFWFRWGETPLTHLSHIGAQRRALNYNLSQTVVYEPLPTAPLELHWRDPSGVQRDFSVPVAQALQGKSVGGGRFTLVLRPASVEVWFEQQGALAATKQPRKVLVYSSTASGSR